MHQQFAAIAKGEVLTAFTQVSDVLAALAHDDDEFAALTASRQAADKALEDSRAALRLGGGPLADVVEAQRLVDRARLNIVQAQSQKLLDIVELYAVTSANWRNTPAEPR